MSKGSPVAARFDRDEGWVYCCKSKMLLGHGFFLLDLAIHCCWMVIVGRDGFSKQLLGYRSMLLSDGVEMGSSAMAADRNGGDALLAIETLPVGFGREALIRDADDGVRSTRRKALSSTPIDALLRLVVTTDLQSHRRDQSFGRLGLFNHCSLTVGSRSADP
ncbi:hypothetical protein ACLOJK_019398 [Asimina triloba]